MALTSTQIRTIQGIVNLFETGHVLGDYGNVTLIAGDTGHLTYGRSQTTLGSGNLAVLLRRYCGNAGARFGTPLRAWLPRVEALDLTLDGDELFKNYLRAAADDRVMRDTQDEFFDDTYFQPALRAADKLGITDPLGCAVVYDSFVHGSWARIRDRVTGTPQSRGERGWVTDYVSERRAWLATNPRSDLRATVYRMDALGRLIELGAWGLELPLVVRGREISSATLGGVPPGSFDGPQPGTRDLAFVTTDTLSRGFDVRLTQLALSKDGADIRADGVFGRASSTCVTNYQRQHSRAATGVADAALVAVLAASV